MWWLLTKGIGTSFKKAGKVVEYAKREIDSSYTWMDDSHGKGDHLIDERESTIKYYRKRYIELLKMLNKEGKPPEC